MRPLLFLLTLTTGLTKERFTMIYEASIQNESQFQQGAKGRRNFSQLYQDQSWEAEASNWGTQELFAARAICMPERSLMAPLSDFYPNTFDLDGADPNIASFYVGYENMDDLAWQSEHALVQANEAVGGVWAALGVLLRKEQFALNVYGPNQAPAIQAQESIHIIQSPLGYTEAISRPLGENATVHLASSIVRLILNYKQDITGARLLSWRDPGVTYRYRGGSHAVSATDNGGVDMWLPGSGNLEQFALLEAKRSLNIVNGEPHVSDEILAQMVGQAIALQRSSSGYIAACDNMYAVKPSPSFLSICFLGY